MKKLGVQEKEFEKVCVFLLLCGNKVTLSLNSAIIQLLGSTYVVYMVFLTSYFCIALFIFNLKLHVLYTHAFIVVFF